MSEQNARGKRLDTDGGQMNRLRMDGRMIRGRGKHFDQDYYNHKVFDKRTSLFKIFSPDNLRPNTFIQSRSPTVPTTPSNLCPGEFFFGEPNFASRDINAASNTWAQHELFVPEQNYWAQQSMPGVSTPNFYDPSMPPPGFSESSLTLGYSQIWPGYIQVEQPEMHVSYSNGYTTNYHQQADLVQPLVGFASTDAHNQLLPSPQLQVMPVEQISQTLYSNQAIGTVVHDQQQMYFPVHPPPTNQMCSQPSPASPCLQTVLQSQLPTLTSGPFIATSDCEGKQMIRELESADSGVSTDSRDSSVDEQDREKSENSKQKETLIVGGLKNIESTEKDEASAKLDHSKSWAEQMEEDIAEREAMKMRLDEKRKVSNTDERSEKIDGRELNADIRVKVVEDVTTRPAAEVRNITDEQTYSNEVLEAGQICIEISAADKKTREVTPDILKSARNTMKVPSSSDKSEAQGKTSEVPTIVPSQTGTTYAAVCTPVQNTMVPGHCPTLNYPLHQAPSAPIYGQVWTYPSYTPSYTANQPQYFSEPCAQAQFDQQYTYFQPDLSQQQYCTSVPQFVEPSYQQLQYIDGTVQFSYSSY